MNVTRDEIAKRCMLLRCPNCGEGGQKLSWFRLREHCPHCGFKHGREDGFMLGTTSIGYVVSFLLVVVPMCVLVVMKILPVWIGVGLAIVGTVALSMGLYPVFMGWVLMTYHIANAEELPANKDQPKP